MDVKNSGKIDAYYVTGDTLSVLQDYTPLPNAIGNRIPLKAYNPVAMTPSNGLVTNIPMNPLDKIKNSMNGNLHFMGAVESAIYSNFPVFRK